MNTAYCPYTLPSPVRENLSPHALSLFLEKDGFNISVEQCKNWLEGEPLPHTYGYALLDSMGYTVINSEVCIDFLPNYGYDTQWTINGKFLERAFYLYQNIPKTGFICRELTGNFLPKEGDFFSNKWEAASYIMNNFSEREIDHAMYRVADVGTETCKETVMNNLYRSIGSEIRHCMIYWSTTWGNIIRYFLSHNMYSQRIVKDYDHAEVVRFLNDWGVIMTRYVD